MGNSIYLQKASKEKDSGEGVGKNGRLQYGFSAMQGWRRNMEDAHIHLPEFTDEYGLFAVFDGHGGSAVAKVCEEKIPFFLENNDNFQKGRQKEALEELFMMVDDYLNSPAGRKRVADVDRETTAKEEAGEGEEVDAGARMGNLAAMLGAGVVGDVEEEGGRKVEMKRRRREKAAAKGVMLSEWDASDSDQELYDGDEDDADDEDKDGGEDDDDDDDDDDMELDIEEVIAAAKLFKMEKKVAATDEMEAQEVAKDLEFVKAVEQAAQAEEFLGSTGEQNAGAGASNAGAASTGDTNDPTVGSWIHLPPSPPPRSSAAESSSSAPQGSSTAQTAPERERGPEDDAGAPSKEGEPSKEGAQPEPITSFQQTPNSDPSPNDPTKKPSSSDDSDDPKSKTEDVLDPAMPTANSAGVVDTLPASVEGLHKEAPDGLDDLFGEETNKALFRDMLAGAGTAGTEKVEDDSDDSDDDDPMSMMFGSSMAMKPEAVPETQGCTAVVVLIQVDKETGKPKKLWCANAGDSRAVLCRNSSEIALSWDHKPLDEKERQRVINAGGIVNEEGRVDHNLNLSRALGDLLYKGNPNLLPWEQKISCFPDVHEQEIVDADNYILIGCDGIYEKQSNRDMVAFINKRMIEGQTSLSKICEEFLEWNIAPTPTAEYGLGCDNMSMMIIRPTKTSPVPDSIPEPEVDADEQPVMIRRERRVQKKPAVPAKAKAVAAPPSGTAASSSASPGMTAARGPDGEPRPIFIPPPAADSPEDDEFEMMRVVPPQEEAKDTPKEQVTEQDLDRLRELERMEEEGMAAEDGVVVAEDELVAGGTTAGAVAPNGTAGDAVANGPVEDDDGPAAKRQRME